MTTISHVHIETAPTAIHTFCESWLTLSKTLMPKTNWQAGWQGRQQPSGWACHVLFPFKIPPSPLSFTAKSVCHHHHQGLIIHSGHIWSKALLGLIITRWGIQGLLFVTTVNPKYVILQVKQSSGRCMLSSFVFVLNFSLVLLIKDRNRH